MVEIWNQQQYIVVDLLYDWYVWFVLGGTSKIDGRKHCLMIVNASLQRLIIDGGRLVCAIIEDRTLVHATIDGGKVRWSWILHMRERERETKKSDHVPMIVLKHVSNVTLHLELCFCDFWLVAKLTQKYFQRSLGCDFQRLGFVLSIFVMMYDMTIESELMMIVDGCGSNDGCENYKWPKCIDYIDNEKTSL